MGYCNYRFLQNRPLIAVLLLYSLYFSKQVVTSQMKHQLLVRMLLIPSSCFPEYRNLRSVLGSGTEGRKPSPDPVLVRAQDHRPLPPSQSLDRVCRLPGENPNVGSNGLSKFCATCHHHQKLLTKYDFSPRQTCSK